MRIDLRSDTLTMPTPGMLAAMMDAQVGDDVYREDPSVNALEAKLAQMFGKDNALFCPSGTMSNQIAIRLHSRPGDEVICHKESHVYRYEGGGIAANSHASARLIDGNRGRLTAQHVQENINDPDDVHQPITRLVCLEDTVNRGGGSYYDFDEIKNIKEVCKRAGLSLHLDGARVFNALVETGIDYWEYARPFDTISICLSKGLGAPVGSVLLGSVEQIKQAKRLRKLMGGGMRQAGYLAAAGIYALDHHIGRLKDDHSRAKGIGEAVKECSLVREVFPIDTNIVIFRIDEAVSTEAFLSSLENANIFAMPFGPSLVRMVTHLGISDEMVDAVQQFLRKLGQGKSSV